MQDQERRENLDHKKKRKKIMSISKRQSESFNNTEKKRDFVHLYQ